MARNVCCKQEPRPNSSDCVSICVPCATCLPYSIWHLSAIGNMSARASDVQLSVVRNTSDTCLPSGTRRQHSTCYLTVVICHMSATSDLAHNSLLFCLQHSIWYLSAIRHMSVGAYRRLVFCHLATLTISCLLWDFCLVLYCYLVRYCLFNIRYLIDLISGTCIT